jgi:hypothetical protein
MSFASALDDLQKRRSCAVETPGGLHMGLIGELTLRDAG